MKILVVEDEPKIARVIQRSLHEAGYAVDLASEVDAAIDMFELQSYDLVLLDLLLPGHPDGGMEVCRRIRQSNQHIPIMMLTAIDSSGSKVTALDLGADDYLAKPFNLDELQARIRALLRRGQKADATVLKLADLKLDPAAHRVWRGNRELDLSSKEYHILEYFMRHPGRVISQTELLDHIWDTEYDGMSNVVEVYIRYLRRKLSQDGEAPLIQTLRGQGYALRTSHD